MVGLIIQLGPQLEGTYGYRNSVCLSIKPLSNLAITHVKPGMISQTTSKAIITTPEMSWYVQGATTWAQFNPQYTSTFKIEAYASPILIAGLHIKISTQTNEFRALEESIQAGTLPLTGCRFIVTIQPFLHGIQIKQGTTYSKTYNAIRRPLIQPNPAPLQVAPTPAKKTTRSQRRRQLKKLEKRLHKLRQEERELDEQLKQTN